MVFSRSMPRSTSLLLSGSTTFSSSSQPSNAPFSTVVVEGTTTSLRPLPLKAPSPIEVRLSGSSTSVSLSQPSNAPLPISLRDSGSVTFSRFSLPLNAPSPIEVTPSGISISVLSVGTVTSITLSSFLAITMPVFSSTSSSLPSG